MKIHWKTSYGETGTHPFKEVEAVFQAKYPAGGRVKEITVTWENDPCTVTYYRVPETVTYYFIRPRHGAYEWQQVTEVQYHGLGFGYGAYYETKRETRED